MNMNKPLILLALICIMSCKCGWCQVMRCLKGEKSFKLGLSEYSEENVCIQCDEGTFMPETDHVNEKCIACSVTESLKEIVITKCNRTHDTEIQCISGYYRQKAETDGEYDKCNECQDCKVGFPARVCQGYNDTVCCPLEQAAVLNLHGIYECKEVPGLCGAGMYTNSSFHRCMSCPLGTYMQEKSHRHTECVKCEILSENSNSHAVIWWPCTRTSPAVFGCEKNYFRGSYVTSMLKEFENQLFKVADEDRQKQYENQLFKVIIKDLLKEAPCKPCTICQEEVVQCWHLDDAVCAEDEDLQGAGPSLKEVTDDDQQKIHHVNDTVKDAPECDQVGQINSLLISGTLLLVVLFVMICFKLALNKRETIFSLTNTCRNAYNQFCDNYLSPFVAFLLFVVANLMLFNGVFGLFAQNEIYIRVALFAVIIAVVFLFYLCAFKYFRRLLKTCWNYVFSSLHR